MNTKKGNTKKCNEDGATVCESTDINAKCNVQDQTVGFQRPLAEKGRVQMMSEMDHLRREREI